VLVPEERFAHSQVVDDLDWWSSWPQPHNVTRRLWRKCMVRPYDRAYSITDSESTSRILNRLMCQCKTWSPRPG